ncbi:MAG: hypothetical protein HC880_12260 [Bacteroidia bacterium]|nr:hypothetical protein [Bacteroidia bacterium]
MKNILSILVLFCLTLSLATAQVGSRSEVQTLFSKEGKTHHGFYFAPVFRVSEIDGDVAFMPGFRGAWTINRAVSLGFEGYGLAPTITVRILWPASGFVR